jgi:hypothetical protein
MKESKQAMQILNIDHLGIVAGIIDEMELVEEVNKMVGIKILINSHTRTSNESDDIEWIRVFERSIISI